MLPLPGRLSTTNCCPSAFPRRSVTRRQIVSGAPPAACETMTFTGRLGHACAWAHAAAAAESATRSARSTFLFISSSSSSQLDDLLRKAVQLLRRARVADQPIVAAPAEGALGDVGRVAHHVHALGDRHGLVVPHERTLDHVVALAVRMQAPLLGPLVALHERVVLGEDVAALRA